MADKPKISKAIVKKITAEKNRVIWANIWRLAKKRGWTKAELARQVGVGPQDINSYRKGKNMGPDIFARFCLALDVHPAELLINYDYDSLELIKDLRKENHDLLDALQKIVQYHYESAKSGNHGMAIQQLIKSTANLISTKSK